MAGPKVPWPFVAVDERKTPMARAMNWGRVASETTARRYGVECARPNLKSPEAPQTVKKPSRRKPDSKKPAGNRLKLAADRRRAIEKLRALREEKERLRATWDALGL